MPDVVDTNVPLVLRFPDEHPPALRDACEELLESIMTSGREVATDLGGEIVAEYFAQLSHSGGPTLGDAFAKWVHERCWTWGQAAMPDIQPRGEYDYGVLDGDDQDFDPSDRKFIAVGKMASAPVHQATDTKWLDWAAALARHGVEVLFVHEPSIRDAYKAKFGYEAP